MPSLRRSVSSPSVRSSPYSGRTRAQGPRRSSGSETSTRRVLADLDWWRVHDGQRDLDAVQEQEGQAQDDDQALDPVSLADDLTTISRAGGEGQPRTPLMWSLHTFDLSSSPEYSLPTLSIGSPSPARRRRAQVSPFSSLESTPEAPETPLESIRLSVAFADACFPPALPPSPLMRPSTRPAPLLTTRSVTFGGFDHISDLGDSFSLGDNFFC